MAASINASPIKRRIKNKRQTPVTSNALEVCESCKYPAPEQNASTCARTRNENHNRHRLSAVKRQKNMATHQTSRSDIPPITALPTCGRRFLSASCSLRSTISLFSTLATSFQYTMSKQSKSHHVNIPFVFGATRRPTHSKWNHSRLQSSESHAIISPKLTRSQ